MYIFKEIRHSIKSFYNFYVGNTSYPRILARKIFDDSTPQDEYYLVGTLYFNPYI